MKLKAKNSGKRPAFDPVLFAASVPSRKPTRKDLADANERPDDAIEPKEYEKMEKMVRDL